MEGAEQSLGEPAAKDDQLSRGEPRLRQGLQRAQEARQPDDKQPGLQFEENYMPIEAAILCAHSPDRELQCQQCIEGSMQAIISEATKTGWQPVETVQAMQEVLLRLRLTFARDLHLEDPLTLEPQPYYDGPIDRATALNRSSMVRAASPQTYWRRELRRPQT
jgi:hypothetical protein